jgi:hypothetical protein
MELVTSLGRADTTLGELTAIVRKDPVIVAQILAPPLNAASHGRTGAQGERPREDRSTTRSAGARPVAAGLHPARRIRCHAAGTGLVDPLGAALPAHPSASTEIVHE